MGGGWSSDARAPSFIYLSLKSQNSLTTKRSIKYPNEKASLLKVFSERISEARVLITAPLAKASNYADLPKSTWKVIINPTSDHVKQFM